MQFLTADLLFSQLIVEMYASQSMHLFLAYFLERKSGDVLPRNYNFHRR